MYPQHIIAYNSAPPGIDWWPFFIYILGPIFIIWIFVYEHEKKKEAREKQRRHDEIVNAIKSQHLKQSIDIDDLPWQD